MGARDIRPIWWQRYFDVYPLDQIDVRPFEENETAIAPDHAYFTKPANWGMTVEQRRHAVRRMGRLVAGVGVAPDPAAPGPWRLTLGVRDRRVLFTLTDGNGAPAGGFDMALAPLAQVMRDYVRICEDYFDAVRHRPPSEIEAMDEGRRAIHGEGARLLAREFDGKAVLDDATLRRFFILVCGLHANT